MKNFGLILFCLGLPFLMAHGAVPSRITYQGRLSKSGVGAAGKHTITVQFITASGEKLPASQTFDVDVPVSGDFSLNIDNIPPDADWINGLPKMRVIVGGETLTPDQSFSATPYALVARNVENLDTSKIKLAGTDSDLLSNWQDPKEKSKISANVIVGTVPYVVPDNISALKIDGTAIVQSTTITQTIQPTQPVVPLIVKGQPNTSPNLNMFEVWDNAAVPAKRFHIKGSGNSYFNGNVGIGTEDPIDKLDLLGGNLILGSISDLGGNNYGSIKFRTPSGIVSLRSSISGLFGNTGNRRGLALDLQNDDTSTFEIVREGVGPEFGVRATGQVYVGGNLGVGTINPTSKLEVAGGDVKVSGKITASSIEASGRYKDKSGDISPVGSIIMYGGVTAPAGWLICDGSAISRSTYADLFSAIGTTFGPGDNSTSFNLPDMKGAAPAGAGMSTGYAINELITLGKKHGDQFQGHRHLVKEQNGVQVIGTSLNAVGGGPGTVEANNGHGGINRGNTEARDIISDGINGPPQTSVTTRGKVVGLNFIIKY